MKTTVTQVVTKDNSYRIINEFFNETNNKSKLKNLLQNLGVEAVHDHSRHQLPTGLKMIEQIEIPLAELWTRKASRTNNFGVPGCFQSYHTLSHNHHIWTR